MVKAKKRRKVDVVIISDVHLGTYGCQSRELLFYLKSIQPSKLILNGDIIDIWQFSKRYWPVSHMQIIKYITNLLAKGTKVVYIPGNHDELLRRFAGFRLGSFRIANKHLLRRDGKKTWIFHGDVFDITMQHSRWLAKLGAIGYNSLILLNALSNFVITRFGGEKISFSKKVKDRVKTAVKFISDFENTAAVIAIDNGYDYVACGHIHQPQIREISNKKGSVTYLNSGDWIENLTALEYDEGKWSLYEFHKDPVAVIGFERKANTEFQEAGKIKVINDELVKDFNKIKIEK